MDAVDIATEQQAWTLAAAIAAARAPVPAGNPGVCRQCHDYSRRLIVGRCAPCRDQRHAAGPIAEAECHAGARR